MPYCYDCGIEVGNGVTECPLCSREIPVLDGTRPRWTAYPVLYNHYADKIAKRKIIAIIATSILVASAVIQSLFDCNSGAMPVTVCQISIVSSLSAIPFLLIALYTRKFNRFVFLNGLAAETLLVFIDYFSGSRGWSIFIAAPIVMTVMAVFTFLRFYFNRTRGRGLHKAGSALVSLSILLMVIEIFSDLYIYDSITMNWSTLPQIWGLGLILMLLDNPAADAVIRRFRRRRR